jgi:predicted metal-binding membrane protein
MGADASFSDKEFAAQVVALSLLDVTALMAWTVEHMQEKTAETYMVAVGLQSYMFKNQKDIADRLAFAWKVHNAPSIMKAASSTPWELLVVAAAAAQCTCGQT